MNSYSVTTWRVFSDLELLVEKFLLAESLKLSGSATVQQLADIGYFMFM